MLATKIGISLIIFFLPSAITIALRDDGPTRKLFIKLGEKASEPVTGIAQPIQHP